MLTLRPLPILVALFVAAVVGTAAVEGQTLSEPAKTLPAGPDLAGMPDIIFYLARGEADACGRDCNEWIAAEGKIDAGAAQRLRRLLAKLGRRRPPIYLHSPGALVAGGIELGRLIRDQKLEVSVAHTVPLGCDRNKPLEKSCEARKRSGQELESQFDPNVAICNSSCVYALAGGAVRLVPPFVKLGIHDVGLDPALKPPRGAANEAKREAHARIQEYLRDMGIDKGLFAAASAIPFTSGRFLERDELVRFGIDRREFGETIWRFVDGSSPTIEKRFFARTDSDKVRYLDGVSVLACGPSPTIRVALARQRVADEASDSSPRSVSINVNGKTIDLPNQMPSHELDLRWASLSANAFDTVGDGMIGVSGFAPSRNGGSAGRLTLNMDGFLVAYAKLRKKCEQQKPLAAAGSPPVLQNPPIVRASNETSICSQEFDLKRRNGDLPVNADSSGYLAWCLGRSAGAACSQEFEQKQRSGDLPANADFSGYIRWCLQQ